MQLTNLQLNALKKSYDEKKITKQYLPKEATITRRAKYLPIMVDVDIVVVLLIFWTHSSDSFIRNRDNAN